jgi:uncharacterized protein
MVVLVSEASRVDRSMTTFVSQVSQVSESDGPFEDGRYIGDEHYERYRSLSHRARAKARICVPERTHLYALAADGLLMVDNYLSDADHFASEGDRVRALAAISYAHGWLDALARMGVLDVDHDSELFTVD